MQVQMPKFAKISSDFICIDEKITGGRAGVRQGLGKMLSGFWKVLEIFATKRVGTLFMASQVTKCNKNSKRSRM